MTGSLLDDVADFLGEYVAFPTVDHLAAATLWVAHAHLYPVFESTPRLAVLSPEPGSGKSRLLEVIHTMAPNPLHVFSASPAAIFRTIEKAPPTLLFDEVDAIFGRHGKNDDHDDLRALLNAGHRRGATIPRCVGATHDVRMFPVFCPVALAGLGDLPDTLMTRSVVIRMRRRAPSEHVRPFRARLTEPAGNAIRDQLAAWANDVSAEVAAAWPDLPPGITDRPADVWEPLLSVADAAGGLWPDTGRAACLALASASVSTAASLGIRLLIDLRTVFEAETKLPTVEILERLHRLDESPWGNLRGQPLDARGLARRLSQYGIGSVKDDYGQQVKLQGYRRADLWDAWERYCPSHPQGSGTSGTNGTTPDDSSTSSTSSGLLDLGATDAA